MLFFLLDRKLSLLTHMQQPLWTKPSDNQISHKGDIISFWSTWYMVRTLNPSSWFMTLTMLPASSCWLPSVCSSKHRWKCRSYQDCLCCVRVCLVKWLFLNHAESAALLKSPAHHHVCMQGSRVVSRTTEMCPWLNVSLSTAAAMLQCMTAAAVDNKGKLLKCSRKEKHLNQHHWNWDLFFFNM